MLHPKQESFKIRTLTPRLDTKQPQHLLAVGIGGAARRIERQYDRGGHQRALFPDQGAAQYCQLRACYHAALLPNYYNLLQQHARWFPGLRWCPGC